MNANTWKYDYLDKLNDKADELETDLAELEAENRRLKAEVQYLRTGEVCFVTLANEEGPHPRNDTPGEEVQGIDRYQTPIRGIL